MSLVKWLLNPLHAALIVAALLHATFAATEMCPNEPPFLLGKVMAQDQWKVDWDNDFKTDKSRLLVSTITRNAGIYNVIMTAGFIWCCLPGICGFPTAPQSINAIRRFFFGGAVLAGLYGGATLSPATYVQAAVGAIGLCVVWCSPRTEKSASQ